MPKSGFKSLADLINELDGAQARCHSLEMAYLSQQDENQALRQDLHRCRQMLKDGAGTRAALQRLETQSQDMKNLRIATDLQDVKLQGLQAVFDTLRLGLQDMQMGTAAAFAANLNEIISTFLPQRFETISSEMVANQFMLPKVQQTGKYVEFQQLLPPEESQEDYKALYEAKCKENDALKRQATLLRRKLALEQKKRSDVQFPELPVLKLEQALEKLETLESAVRGVPRRYVLQAVQMPDFQPLQREILRLARLQGQAVGRK